MPCPLCQVADEVLIINDIGRVTIYIVNKKCGKNTGDTFPVFFSSSVISTGMRVFLSRGKLDALSNFES